jgi:hypothetical protein
MWFGAGPCEAINLIGVSAHDKDSCREYQEDAFDFLVSPATKSKPLGQEGTVKMSGCNKLW